MGQSESTLPLKRFVDDPKDIVSDAIEGLLWTTSDVELLNDDPEVHIVARANWRKDKVAILAGGGAGHDPADVGWVGEGMLTAAVCGEIFTPPAPAAVLRALVAVTGEAGCLVIIRNCFSTVLSFRAAIMSAEQENRLPPGAKVRVIYVADDIATSVKKANGEADFKVARGVAGMPLVIKVAGAAAEAGLSLDEVYEEAQSMSSVIRTQGVCFTSCNIPGQPNRRPIPPDEMEIGCGVHGECRTRVKANTTATEIIDTMISQLKLLVCPEAPLVAMLNNLGVVPQNEMSILAALVMRSELADRIRLLIGPGHLLTSLDTNGISLSIAPLNDVRIQRLCAPTSCRMWMKPVVPAPPRKACMGVGMKRVWSYCFEASKEPVVHALVMRVCEALEQVESQLNKLDFCYKNGDCGRNLAHAARLVMAALPSMPLKSPAQFCISLSRILRSAEGALCALFSIWFAQAGGALNSGDTWEGERARGRLIDAFLRAQQEVERIGDFAEGRRSFADAMGPALRAAGQGLAAMALAAQRGARATSGMCSAVGRAAHTQPEHMAGFPDTGAMAVAFVLTVLAAPEGGGLRHIQDDAELADSFEIGETIGKGAFGSVNLGVDRNTGRRVAIKRSVRGRESGPRSFEGLDFVEKQRMSNWLFTEKPHIVHVYEVLVSPTSVHLIMEHLSGPELSQWLSSVETLTEKQAARVVRQMLRAAREIHASGMVHRDLKLENFVFTDDSAKELKLVDVVGTMRIDPENESAGKELCGTGIYMSPEALLGHCSPAVDVWALGVAVYLILSRAFPFPATSLRELHEAHQRPLDLESDPWPTVSEEAKELVRALLSPKASERPSADAAAQFRWITTCDDEEGPCWEAHLPTQKVLPETPLGIFLHETATQSMQKQLSGSRIEAPTVVKTLYLVRHGEALHNIQEREVKRLVEVAASQQGMGKSSPEVKAAAEKMRKLVLEDEAFRDASLSPDGKVMALATQAEINRLRGKGLPAPTCILVSPLERTLQTAALVFPSHPNTHVVEGLRERRTGLPCDERKRAVDVAIRQTFCYMSFNTLKDHDMCEGGLLCQFPGHEDAHSLRERTGAFLESLRGVEDGVIGIVTHKGFLRELERGPLGQPGATEFGNCELRIYDVALPAAGGPAVARLRYSRASEEM